MVIELNKGMYFLKIRSKKSQKHLNEKSEIEFSVANINLLLDFN